MSNNKEVERIEEDDTAEDIRLLVVQAWREEKSATNVVNEVMKIIHQELQKAREEEREIFKHEVIKLLAGNTPIYDKRKASGYNEGITSGWYAAREFIRLELNAKRDQSELDQPLPVNK